MLSGGYSLDMKYMLAGWFQFQALLCRFSGLHPLIMIKTCLPIAVILLHYSVVWNLCRAFSGTEESDGLLTFMLVYAVLTEAAWGQLSTSWSYYFLTWAWYGKAFLQLIVLPFLLFVLLDFCGKKLGDWLLIAMVAIAGLAASTMGFLLIPAELGLFLLACLVSYVIRQRRICV
jgi:hypothetical protein